MRSEELCYLICGLFLSETLQEEKKSQEYCMSELKKQLCSSVIKSSGIGFPATFWISGKKA